MRHVAQTPQRGAVSKATSGGLVLLLVVHLFEIGVDNIVSRALVGVAAGLAFGGIEFGALASALGDTITAT